MSASGGSAHQTERHEGGIAGFFHNLFGGSDETSNESNEDRGYYTDAVNRGQAVVTANVDDSKIETATKTLNRYQPMDFDQQVEGNRTDKFSGSGTPARAEGERVIPVVQEEMQVNKQAAQTGGVRVYTRVSGQPVSENVTLREEHARVERRPVDRAATEADFNLKDEVIEVIETSEQAVVGKNARVVEEVVIGKDTTERSQTVSDTVRRTDVRVEQISPEARQDFRSDYENNYAKTGGDSSGYEPAYSYGYGLGNDPRYQGKNWSDIESSVKSDYMRANPNSAWDKASNAVKYGWDKATGQR